MKPMKLVALTGEELALLKRILSPEHVSTTLICSLTDAEGDLATDLLSTLNGVTPDSIVDNLVSAATEVLAAVEDNDSQRERRLEHAAQVLKYALERIAPSVEEEPKTEDSAYARAERSFGEGE